MRPADHSHVIVELDNGTLTLTLAPGTLPDLKSQTSQGSVSQRGREPAHDDLSAERLCHLLEGAGGVLGGGEQMHAVKAGSGCRTTSGDPAGKRSPYREGLALRLGSDARARPAREDRWGRLSHRSHFGLTIAGASCRAGFEIDAQLGEQDQWTRHRRSPSCSGRCCKERSRQDRRVRPGKRRHRSGLGDRRLARGSGQGRGRRWLFRCWRHKESPRRHQRPHLHCRRRRKQRTSRRRRVRQQSRAQRRVQPQRPRRRWPRPRKRPGRRLQRRQPGPQRRRRQQPNRPRQQWAPRRQQPWRRYTSTLMALGRRRKREMNCREIRRKRRRRRRRLQGISNQPKRRAWQGLERQLPSSSQPRLRRERTAERRRRSGRQRPQRRCWPRQRVQLLGNRRQNGERGKSIELGSAAPPAPRPPAGHPRAVVQRPNGVAEPGACRGTGKDGDEAVKKGPKEGAKPGPKERRCSPRPSPDGRRKGRSWRRASNEGEARARHSASRRAAELSFNLDVRCASSAMGSTGRLADRKEVRCASPASYSASHQAKQTEVRDGSSAIGDVGRPVGRTEARCASPALDSAGSHGEQTEMRGASSALGDVGRPVGRTEVRCASPAVDSAGYHAKQTEVRDASSAVGIVGRVWTARKCGARA